MKKYVLLLSTVIVITLLIGCTQGEKEESNNVTSEAEANQKSDIDDFTKLPNFSAPKNSSEMVDLIAKTAKDNAFALTEEQAEEIIWLISVKSKSNSFFMFENNKSMERYMWYGYLLSYKYESGSPEANLGDCLLYTSRCV